MIKFEKIISLKSLLPTWLRKKLKKSIRLFLSPPLLSAPFSKSFVPILSCQRSGTTLTFLILTSHPKIRGVDEHISQGFFPPFAFLVKNWLQGYLTCFKLPTETSELEYIVNAFPDAKIIWPVRNPYAVVSSMRLLKAENGTWISSYAKGELDKLAVLFPEILSIDLDRLDEISLGAYVWKYKNLAIDRYRSSGLNLFVFKYEDLLNAPKEVTSKILDFCGLEWSDNVLNHEKFHDSGQRHFGGTVANKPLDISRKQPKFALSEQEIELIASICKDQILAYGY